MNPEVRKIVEKELRAVVAKLKKKANDLDKKGLQAIVGPTPRFSEWTEKQRNQYFAETQEQKMAKSDRCMEQQLNHEGAAQEIESLLFTIRHR